MCHTKDDGDSHKKDAKKEKKLEVYETFEEMGLKPDLLRGMYGAGKRVVVLCIVIVLWCFAVSYR